MTTTKTVPTTVTVTAVPEPIKWRMQSSWPAVIIHQQTMERFADRVTEISGGRLVIEPYAGGALVGAFEVLDATSAGTLDAYHTWPGYWIGKCPASPLFGGDTPFPFDTLAWLTWMYAEGLDLWHQMYVDAGYNIGEVLLLGIYGGPEDFAWTHKPLRTLEDFKGLNIRVSGYWAEVFREMGCTVVTLPGAEVYPALERGTIDATEWSMPSIDWDMGFQDIMEYVVVTAFRQAYATFDAGINKDSWDALSPDLKTIVEAAAYDGTMWLMTESLRRDIPTLKRFEEAGVQIITLDPEVPVEMFRLLRAVYDKVTAEDPFTGKVLDSITAFYEAYEAYAEKQYPYPIRLK